MDLPTGYATSCKQANSKQMEEIIENRQEDLTLIISSEGRYHGTPSYECGPSPAFDNSMGQSDDCSNEIWHARQINTLLAEALITKIIESGEGPGSRGEV